MTHPAALPATVSAYLEHVASRARAWGVECLLADTPTVAYAGQGHLQVSGYFIDHPSPLLAVATGKPFQEWFPILVHEACHMEQWHQAAPQWLGNRMPDGKEAVDWLDEWCAHARELTPAQLSDAVRRAKDVEMDCERRVLEAIAVHGLPLDPGSYARKANAYVHFYDHVAATRRWNEPGHAPYQLEAVWQCAPDRLVAQATPELSAAFARHYPAPTRAPRP